MTSAHERAVCESADAELRGDAATALRLHRSVPFFRRSTHGDRLQQLADLGSAAPGWMVNRWVTEQARRRMWTGGDQTGANRALQLLVPLIYPDHIPFERIGCRHPEQVIPWINELDWVVRQADVYDLGALRRFINDHAADELLDRTDELVGWADAPMRACRVEYVDRERTRPMWVRDLTSGEELELLDLGAPVAPGQHVLGRVVPISTRPGLMFDWRPMPVSAEAAEAVAEDPRLWLTREAVDGPPAGAVGVDGVRAGEVRRRVQVDEVLPERLDDDQPTMRRRSRPRVDRRAHQFPGEAGSGCAASWMTYAVPPEPPSQTDSNCARL